MKTKRNADSLTAKKQQKGDTTPMCEQKHLISVQTGDWYDESDDDTSMRMARECGIEALDYNIDHVLSPHKLLKGEKFPQCDLPVEEFVACYAPLKAASEKYGIAISQMHAPFPSWLDGYPEQSEYVLQTIEKVIAVCAYVGCPALVVHPFVGENRTRDREINLAIYRRLMPAAKKYGVKVCLENMFTTFKGHVTECFCTNAEDSVELIDLLNEEAGEECFGFCYDVGHANITGKNQRDYLEKIGHRLTVLHIHDNDGVGDRHMIPFTQSPDLWAAHPGTDWEGFIAGLRAIGYKGNLSFETFRASRHFPREVHPAMLQLVASIGAYFRRRIEE